MLYSTDVYKIAEVHILVVSQNLRVFIFLNMIFFRISERVYHLF